MSNDHTDRTEKFITKVGQEKLRNSRVTVVGVGGIGTHVVQQLSFLRVGTHSYIDAEEIKTTSLNRYIGSKYNDPIPGSKKVDIAERLAHSIEPTIKISKIFDSLVSSAAFTAIRNSDYVFGCVDNEGVRLILNELCSAYDKPYIDVSSEITASAYGGQIVINESGRGCLLCLGVLDLEEAQRDLSGPDGKRQREALYGQDPHSLDPAGPSVVSLNGVVASLAITEFLVWAAELRAPKKILNYYGHSAKVTVGTDEPFPDCYYCKSLRGKGLAADVERYINQGIGAWLR